MIFGNVRNEFFEQQAALLPAPLCAALHYLRDHDLASHEPGRFDIEVAGVPMILQVLDLSTAPREDLRPEIHRKYIDVQFLAAGGPEDAGFYNDDGSSVTAFSDRISILAGLPAPEMAPARQAAGRDSRHGRL